VSGLGANNVLWVDAASFAVSAALIAATVPQAAPPAERTARSYRHDLAEGLRFVFHDPPIRAIFVSATVLNFLISPLLAVILPVYMKATYNSAASLGLVIAAFGGGSVLGAIAYGTIGDRFARRSTFIAGVAGIGAAIAILAVLPPVPVMAGAMLLGGVVSGPNGPLVATVLQERTPEGLLGRVSGTTTAIGFAAAPLGVAVAGYVVDAIGVRPTLIGSAVLFLGVICALAYDHGLGGMDDTRNGQR
jgi:MFS family permease